MGLKNKKILITAGPTWVPIDGVRVISNIATGQTGILLAEKLVNLGAQVTLLLGPVEACCLDKRVKIIRFKFFDELKDSLIKELKSKKYKLIIHSAAVSDYCLRKLFRDKLNSGIKNLRLNLIPTPKILDLIKKIVPSLKVIAFKFEIRVRENTLISKARLLLKRSGADLVVANTIDKENYQAYIVEKTMTEGPIPSKDGLVKELINNIGDLLCQS